MKPGHLDRAAGVMVGLACGDALGAAYEFGGPYSADMRVDMTGGGAFDWDPGEWTDDTSMAIPLLEVIETGDRTRDDNLRSAVTRWIEWMEDAKDVGNQTSAVLGEAERIAQSELCTMNLAAVRAAQEFQEQFPDAAGNGSLMRTAPYGLVGQDLGYVAKTAAGQSELTHHHEDAVTACAIWSATIRHAVETGELDVRVGLRASVSEAREPARFSLWQTRIDEAEHHLPDYFTENGWVVHAFQGAWSSIVHTGHRSDNDPDHLRRALEMAVRGGGDTDTVAAIAGGLIGGAYGVSAIPLEWKRKIHGLPGWHAEELVEHAVIAHRTWTESRPTDPREWPSADHVDYSSWGQTDTCVQHPHDRGVYLGGIDALDEIPDDVNAVVSLCRIGRKDVPDSIPREDRVAVWLVDSDDPADNQHLDYVLAEAADMVARMRVEGKTVLVHCVQAHSRTPTVAALYSARHLGVDAETALRDITAVLPDAHPNPAFRSAVRRIAGGGHSRVR
ncbi:ADP-ribosylglycohydrolase family protein [Brevibacterium sanguinis]|uniref:ADP-ribosylglycohydrolase family protein n=1 Tax=Brevibacterium sanguinis TaxID=232444 RepID=UPI0031D2D0D6